jgi:hypothetical protein
LDRWIIADVEVGANYPGNCGITVLSVENEDTLHDGWIGKFDLEPVALA